MSREVAMQFGGSSVAQQSINSGFTVEEKIWENPDTTAQFGATTLNLNLSKYDAIRFVTIGNNAENEKIYINSICLKGERTNFRVNSSNGTNLAWFEREVEVGESTVLITACTRRTQGSSTMTTFNNYQIPYMIYGVRFSSGSGSGSGGGSTPETPQLVVETIKAIDNLSISASTYLSDETASVAKAGYIPIGIVGWSIGNGSSSGSGASFVFLYRAGVDIDGTAHFSLRNTRTSASKIAIWVDVLYQKL